MTSSRALIQASEFISESSVTALRLTPNINQSLVTATISTYQFAREFAQNLPTETPHNTPSEKQKVIATILLIRILEITASILILAAHGIRKELSTLFRVFLDAYFVLGNVCSDLDFVPIYFQTDLPQRLKLLNAAAKQDHELFRAINEYAQSSIRKEIETKIKEENIQAFNSFSYAEKIGCSHLYDSMYRISSSSVHTTPRCLEDYVETDAHGNVISITSKSNLDHTHQTIYDTTWFLLILLGELHDCFSIADKSRVSQLKLELQASMGDAQDLNETSLLRAE